MASPKPAPLGITRPRSTIVMLAAIPLAAIAAGWWLRGPLGAGIAAAAGMAAACGIAWMRPRAPRGHRAGEVATELKTGVTTGVEARTRAAVMEGGTRVGVVPAGRSARGHRDRDL
jgi:hypothetical protein